MNRSTPGLPVYQQLPEFTQTHVHQVSDAIQPSHPLLSPSPPAPNPSQHRRERNPERPPSNSHGDWPFLRPPERVPEVPIVSEEHLPQIEKSRSFSPPGEMRPISAEASRGYSHLTSGTSKGSFTPLLQLKKFPDIPVSNREEARDSRPYPEEPRFRLLAREEGSFP